MPRKPFLVSNARRIAGNESSASNTSASRARFSGEWASEWLTSANRSRAERRQFMAGSDERPVSSAKTRSARSPK
ncbi:MAG: hypothetical protein MUC63_10765, partial [Planctomycetes bacterium]|nr:hypothetical protein [Planctomycetota bacterium]